MARNSGIKFKCLLENAFIGLAGYTIISMILGSLKDINQEVVKCISENSDDSNDFEEKIPPQYTNPNREGKHISDLQFQKWINGRAWSQEDPELVDAVRKHYLVNPTRTKISLKTYHNVQSGSLDRLLAVEGLLRKMKPGFFVECGAYDGEAGSATLWLEKELGWTGLLIECDPFNFRKLLAANRQSWSANVCLSNHKVPKRIRFHRSPASPSLGGLIHEPEIGAVLPIKVQSLPLFTLLLGLNTTVVDYMILDIEGNEMDVIRTIPFDKITLKVLLIDYSFTKEGKKGTRRYMESKGFTLYKTIPNSTTYGEALVFVHSTFYKEILDEDRLVGEGGRLRLSRSSSHSRKKRS